MVMMYVNSVRRPVVDSPRMLERRAFNLTHILRP